MRGLRIAVPELQYLRDYMTEEKDNSPRPPSGTPMSKDEVALELMRFITVTTGLGKTSSGAGFGGKAAKAPEEQVDSLIQLFERCRSVVGKGN
jgi:hypothetical protein